MTRMHKSLKSVVLVVLMLAMILLPVAAVNAAAAKNYLALGDSIAYGLTAELTDGGVYNGYANRFAASLGSGWNYRNDAWPGFATDDLLAYVNANASPMKLESFNICTISIGSNNLLGPTIAAAAMLYQIDPADPIYNDPSDPGGYALKMALAAAIQAEIAGGGNPVDTLSRLMNPLDPAGMAYNQALMAGLADFAEQWPAIIARIRQLNPRGEIYVNTAYNPVRSTGTSDPFYALYLKGEALIGSINLIIKSYALVYHYKVVDVYKGFKAYPATSSAVLTFSIPNAIQALIAGNEEQLTLALDPHPTDFGHQKICEWLIATRKATPSWYWWLPVLH